MNDCFFVFFVFFLVSAIVFSKREKSLWDRVA